MPKDFLFTSESVTEGHPDKIADQISRRRPRRDPREGPAGARRLETLVKTGLAIVAGEVTTNCYVDIPKIVRSTICSIGYTDCAMGFDGNTCGVMVAIEQQSPGHRPGRGQQGYKEQGAGDQGMMFGYACDETPELMPAPISLRARADQAARRRAPQDARLAAPRRQEPGHGASTRTASPVRIDAVVVSTQHADDVTNKKLHEAIMEEVIEQGAAQEAARQEDQVLHQPDRPLRHRRPDGRLGPHRPQDHRRHLRRHGPSRRRRVLRQGPVEGRPLGRYMGRYIAKNIVAAGLARRCEVQVAYAIGVAEPVSRDGRHLRHRHGRRGEDRRARCAQVFGLQARARSSSTSTCSGPSTRRPPPTATSAARRRSSPGSAPTRRTRSARRSAPGRSAPSAAERSGFARRAGRRVNRCGWPRYASAGQVLPASLSCRSSETFRSSRAESWTVPRRDGMRPASCHEWGAGVSILRVLPRGSG